VSAPASPALPASGGLAALFQQRRAALAEIRRQVRQKREAGVSGIECSQWFSDQMDGYLQAIIAADVEAADARLQDAWAILAIGGSGR
jgi:hypothetical protein